MVIVEGSRLTGVPCVQASDEAEAQAAYMARKGFVDAVYTMGYDAFLFGSPLVVRRVGVDAAAGASLEDLLNRIGLTLPQLVDAAVLAGTDFNKGVRGVGMRATVSPVRRYGCLEAVLEALNLPERVFLEARRVVPSPGRCRREILLHGSKQVSPQKVPEGKPC